MWLVTTNFMCSRRGGHTMGTHQLTIQRAPILTSDFDAKGGPQHARCPCQMYTRLRYGPTCSGTVDPHCDADCCS